VPVYRVKLLPLEKQLRHVDRSDPVKALIASFDNFEFVGVYRFKPLWGVQKIRMDMDSLLMYCQLYLVKMNLVDKITHF